MWFQTSFNVATTGRGTEDVTDIVQAAVNQAVVKTGMCHIFLQHTSASLMLCENADPDVRRDLETFMSALVPDGHREFRHTAEGPDDMSAHVRSVLTHNSLSIPIEDGSLALGTWQGIYLWEHRARAHQRHLHVTVQGE